MKKALKWVQPCKFLGKYPSSWAGYTFLQWSPHAKNWHEGVDYNNGSSDSDRNTPILATADGVVDWVGYHKGWGWHIFIEHNHPTEGTIYSHYAHLEPGTILVKAGQTVTYGQRIAGMGDSGWAEMAVHLHFEIRRAIGQGYAFVPTPAKGWDHAKTKQYYFDPFYFIEKNKNVVQNEPTVPSNQEAMPEELQKLLDKYKVKSSQELQEMVDRELEFLEAERNKNRTISTELEAEKDRRKNITEEYDDFVLEVVEILNPAKPLPAVTDKELAIQLLKDVISTTDELRAEVKKKDKEYADRERELLEENERLKTTIKVLKEKIEDLKKDINSVEKDVEKHGEKIVETKKQESFLDILKKIFLYK